MLNEIEASQLSNTEFKAMVIRKLNELTAKLQGNYEELTENCISIKNDIETINKGQKEMKYIISELKNTVEGIKSRLREAEDKISKLEDEVGKNSQKEHKKKKRLKRMKRG